LNVYALECLSMTIFIILLEMLPVEFAAWSGVEAVTEDCNKIMLLQGRVIVFESLDIFAVLGYHHTVTTT